MSHSYPNGNSKGNYYLNKKRHKEDIPINSIYRFEKSDKFQNYGNHGKYNNSNYGYSKQLQENNYYNTSSTFCSNYNNSKPFYNKGYFNKQEPKRGYKKSLQYHSYQNINEGIRNLSNCEISSPPLLSFKYKQDLDSLKSFSSSTLDDSNSNLTDSNIIFNIKNINKLLTNINSYKPLKKDNYIFKNYSIFNRQKQKIQIYKNEYNEKFKKNVEEDEEEIFSFFKFPEPSLKLLNYEPFNRDCIKIEENPLDNFEIYPKNLYEINTNFIKKPNSAKTEFEKNENLRNVLPLKSCYLLSKIPNWRLVTNFVPSSFLTKEKYTNIIPLEDDERIVKKEQLKNDLRKEEEKEKNKSISSYLIYSEKFEIIIERSLKQIEQKKKHLNKNIFNKKYIISQYSNDILKIKNGIKQNIYKIKYLDIKLENLSDSLDEKINQNFFLVS